MRIQLWFHRATAAAFSILLAAFFTSSTAPRAQAQQTNRQIAQRFNQLPPCQLDSFVYQAGGQAEAIYGDEGIRTPPPFFGFDQSHRIDAGILRQRDRGLTTGHGSNMPSAWGFDEFIARPGEFCRSGAKSNPYPGAQDDSYDYSREIYAYENTLERLQNRINIINDRLEELFHALTTISQADISGRQDINQEIQALQTARFNRMVKMQVLQEEMRQDFGDR
jgi:hypothetical protein